MSGSRTKVIEGLKVGELPMRPMDMRVFICCSHDGKQGYSTKRASIIVAKNEVHARELLDRALVASKLLPFVKHRYILSEVPLDRWYAEILVDGS